MRTTLKLDDDVQAAAEALRRERNIGLGEAVNELARAGMQRQNTTRARFSQRSADLGIRVDISSVADALESLDGVG
ncbi:MAG: CopG family transcriptional regulator [Arachnia sp.]